MTATTASDPCGVEYYFDCTAGDGGHDSTWQASPTYEDTGLSPDTQYTYHVQARDLSANHNTGGWSTSQSATTDSVAIPIPIPVGWWKLNEASGTTADDSAGTNNGTVSGALWSSGHLGNALSFDGVDDVVDIVTETGIANLPLADFTVTFWMNWNPNPEEWFDTILGKYGNNAGWQIYLSRSSQTLNFYMILDGSSMAYESAVSSIPANSWVHVACVYTASSKTAEIYIGGTEPGYAVQTPGSGNYKTDSGVRTQFGRADWSGQYFAGMLDDIRIYASGLTGPQIQVIMDSVPSPADFNGDGVVNAVDMEAMAQQWLATADPGTLQADIVVDGRVDLADFAKLAEDWLE
jgi:hypothetical protein